MIAGGKKMDCDLERCQTRSGRRAACLVLLTDADVSDPDNESDSDTEQNISEGLSSEEADSSSDDDIPLAQVMSKDTSTSYPVNGRSSDDDVPLAQLQNKNNSTRDSGNQRSIPKASHPFRWRKISALKPSDIQWTGQFSDPPDDQEPADYFRHFFPRSLIDVIVEQTNVYSVQSGSGFRTDACEIEQYLGVLMKMGLMHMPRYQMYWSKELRFPPVADVMSRNRFTDASQYWLNFCFSYCKLFYVSFRARTMPSVL